MIGIVNAIAAETGFEGLNPWRVTYQGRPLSIQNSVYGKIHLPGLALVVLVGPSGSDQSTFARRHLSPPPSRWPAAERDNEGD